MKGNWNFFLWGGFLIVVLGLLSYVPFFSLFPVTRDFPWANLALFLIGGWLLTAGWWRAVKQPQRYRGKILGPVFGALSVAGISLFLYGLLIHGRQLPAAAGAPRVGQKAPDFALVDADGKATSLQDLLSSMAGKAGDPKPKAVLLMFYRGHW